MKRPARRDTMNRRANKLLRETNTTAQLIECFPGRACCTNRTLCSIAIRNRKHNTTAAGRTPKLNQRIATLREPQRDKLTIRSPQQPRGRPSNSWSHCISYLSWPRLGVEPAALSEIAIDRELFRIILGLPSPRPPQRKSGGSEMNE